MPEASNVYRKIEVKIDSTPRGRVFSLQMFPINIQTLWVYEMQRVFIKCLIQLFFLLEGITVNRIFLIAVLMTSGSVVRLSSSRARSA